MLLASSFDQGRFFKAADFTSDRKLRIKSVSAEMVGTGAEKERKLVVFFTSDERGLVLNRVNNRTLRGAFGDDVSKWEGKVIVLFPTTDGFKGQQVPVVRIRIPTTPVAAPAVDPELNDEFDN
jgi:hypothetical protein